MITAEDLVLEIDSTEESNSFKLGTVTDLFENETAKIQFDGEEAPSEKQFAYLGSYAPTIGDRVLLGVLGGTYIILGKVNYDVPPDTEEEIDRYLFDLKQVIMQKGFSVTGNASVDGDLNVTGDFDIEGHLKVDTFTANDISSEGDISATGKVSAPTVNATSSVDVGNSSVTSERIDTPLIDASTGRINTLIHDGLWLRFFNASSLSQKRTVGRISTSTTLTIEVLRDKLNALIDALAAYGLINN